VKEIVDRFLQKRGISDPGSMPEAEAKDLWNEVVSDDRVIGFLERIGALGPGGAGALLYAGNAAFVLWAGNAAWGAGERLFGKEIACQCCVESAHTGCERRHRHASDDESARFETWVVEDAGGKHQGCGEWFGGPQPGIYALVDGYDKAGNAVAKYVRCE
jgi:hypothetical protein